MSWEMKSVEGLIAFMVIVLLKTVSCSEEGELQRIHDTSLKNASRPASRTIDSLHDASVPNKYLKYKTKDLLQHARVRRAVSTVVRLQGGSSPEEGRLEVNSNGQWGTVCDDDFDVMDAVVVCRMLGHRGEIPTVQSNAFYGPGTGPIVLDDVRCYGTETSILSCLESGLGRSSCGHSEDVGVKCFPSWASRSIRLRNGAYPWEGGVEVFHNAVWGSVCDDHFDVSDAQVVCRSMGYPSVNPLIHTTSYYGHDMGPFWIDELRCTGTETSVALCDGDHWGQHDCDQNEYVGVNCRPDIPTVPVRLVGGAQVWEGRLEVLNNGNRKWGTVCDDMFNEIDAMVVCRMLGYLGYVNMAVRRKAGILCIVKHGS